MKRSKWLPRLGLALGCGCLCYYLSITLAYGRISFAWVFLLLGLSLISLSTTHRYWLPYWKRISSKLRLCFWICFGLGLGCFLFVEGIIFYYGNLTPSQHGDVIVVLGAGLRNGNEISASLQYRLDEAVSLHKKTPETMIVVSGGQGSDETISEAFAMRQYLITQGVKEDLILLEDKSTNTSENLQFTRNVLDEHGIPSNRISLITNDFHMYRAMLLAQANGYEVFPQPADSLWTTQLCFYTREFFGVVRAWLIAY